MPTSAPHRTSLPSPPRGAPVAADGTRPAGPTEDGGVHDASFELLFQDHRDGIYVYALRMLRDHARAEDVVQEVFVSAMRAMRAGQRPRHVRAWLHEIARRACIDQWRGVTRRGEVSYDAPEMLSPADSGRLTLGEDSVLRAAEDHESLDTLRTAFTDLPPLQHSVLVQRELEGRSPGEIAERLGVSQTVVEGQLARGRRQLTRTYRELQSGERCAATRELSAATLERTLGIRERQRMASHLRSCERCQRHARTLGLDPRSLERRIFTQALLLLPLPLFRRLPLAEPSLASEAAGGVLLGKVAVGAAVLAASGGGALVAGDVTPIAGGSQRATAAVDARALPTGPAGMVVAPSGAPQVSGSTLRLTGATPMALVVGKDGRLVAVERSVLAEGEARHMRLPSPAEDDHDVPAGVPGPSSVPVRPLAPPIVGGPAASGPPVSSSTDPGGTAKPTTPSPSPASGSGPTPGPKLPLAPPADGTSPGKPGSGSTGSPPTSPGPGDPPAGGVTSPITNVGDPTTGTPKGAPPVSDPIPDPVAAPGPAAPVVDPAPADDADPPSGVSLLAISDDATRESGADTTGADETSTESVGTVDEATGAAGGDGATDGG